MSASCHVESFVKSSFFVLKKLIDGFLMPKEPRNWTGGTDFINFNNATKLSLLSLIPITGVNDKYLCSYFGRIFHVFCLSIWQGLNEILNTQKHNVLRKIKPNLVEMFGVKKK